MALKFLNDGYFAGKVGIGTLSPSTKLHVFEAGTAMITVDSGATSPYKAGIEFLRSSINGGSIYNDGGAVQIKFDSYFAYDSANPSRGGFQFRTAPVSNNTMVDAVRIDALGNVGIGTTNPGTKLDVLVGGTNHIQLGASALGSTGDYIGGLYYSSNKLLMESFLVGTGYQDILLSPNGGNVGIGTTSPAYKLDVNGSVNVSFGNTNGYRINTNRVLSQISGAVEVGVLDYKTTYPNISFNNDNTFRVEQNGSTKIIVNSSGNVGIGTTSPGGGNVGIGTTSPSQKLEVNGNAIIGGGTLDNPQSWGKILQVQNTGSNGAGISVKDSNNEWNLATYNGVFNISDGIEERIIINSSGNVGIGTTSPGAKLDVNGATYLRNVALDSISGYSGNNIQFTNAGNTTFNNSNVGIGTTSPTQKLQVDGRIRVPYNASNLYYFGQDNGSIGYGSMHPFDNGGNYTFDTNYAPSIGSYKFKYNGTEIFRLRDTGAFAFGSGGNDYGVSGQILKSLGNASPTWVDASTVIGGPYLPLAGGTITGNLTVNGTANIGNQLTFPYGSIGDYIYHTGDGDTFYGFPSADNFSITTGGNANFAVNGTTTYLKHTGNTKLITTSTGVTVTGDGIFTGNISAVAGTFTGALSVGTTAGANITMLRTSANYINATNATGYLVFRTGGYNTALTLNAAQNATFAGNVDIDGGTLNVGSSNQVNIVASGFSLFPSLKVNNNGFLGSASVPTQIQLLSSGNTIFTGTVTAPTFLGDLNGTINTVTTAVTKANATNDTTVATTAFVQNLIGTIPAGLVFQGTWNAATNTPTLTSGTGTTGNFYIVSVDGSTNLDGITDWKVGDWAVFIEQGASDQWEKVDNSSVLDGSGTGNQITKWAGSGTSNTLTDSIVTDNGTSVGIGTTLPGAGYKLEVNGLLKSNGGYFTNPVSIFDSSITENPRLSLGRSSGETLNFDVTDRDAIIYHKQDEVDIYPHTLSLSVDSNATGNNVIDFKFRSNDGTTVNATPMTILSSGNVGIGTDDPAQDLTLYRSSGDTNFLISSNNGASQIFFGDTESDNIGRIDYDHSDNSLNFAVNADERMRITSTGNVGIGTTSPSEKLEVSQSSNNQGFRISGYDTNSLQNYRVYISSDGSTNLRSTSYIRAIANSYYYDLNNGGAFIVRSNATSEILHVNNNGNVGIGITSPNYPLEVAGASTVSIAYQRTGVSAKKWGFHSDNSNTYWQNLTDGNLAITVANAGNVGIGTTSPAKTLDVNGDVYINSNYPSNAAASDLTIGKTTTGDHGLTIVTGASNTAGIFFADNNNNDAGIIKYQHSNNSMQFVTNRSEAMRIDTSGNVMIGNTNASAKLDIRQDTGYAFRTENASGYTFRVEADTGNIEAAGSIQMADDTDAASAAKVGTLKYRVSGNNSYVDMCMQTGAATYEWVNIVQNNW
jgi:hypothetical protein